MKSLTIPLVGYLISGEATLSLWGGGTGTIPMEETTIPLNKLTKNNILACVNDNGFGCEAIIGATVDIYELYDKDVRELVRTFELDESTCRRSQKYFFKGV